MKKIFIFMLFLFNFYVSFAGNLDVKTNLESWEYEFAIEVNLIANEKNAKIFYYTDGEWRMDNIKEFSKPILIKEDTTLDYYATNANFEDTLIKTANYKINYSDKVDLEAENDKIIIKNNSWKIQNIWYWKIESNNLNYELNPNTFLENKEIFELNYNLADNETIKLISPDKKIVKNFTYKTPPLIPPQLRGMSSNSETGGIVENTQTTENTNSWNIENINKNDESNEKDNEVNEIPTQLRGISSDSETGGVINSWFNLEENLKTSAIDTKKTWNKNNIYIIILIFGSLFLYNVWLLMTKTDTYKKIKNKNKKSS